MNLNHLVTDLCAQVGELDAIRREHFLDWLGKHHRCPQAPTLETLPFHLHAWLGALSPQGMQWELHLLSTEIAWWRSLSAARLCRLLEQERTR